MNKIIKYKSDIIAYISSIIIMVGTFVPIVVIDGVSKAFITENGKLVFACAIISVILYIFKVGFFSFIPSIGILLIIFVFYNGINDNIVVLNQLNIGSTQYGIGLYLMILGSILLIIASIINFIDSKKVITEESNEQINENLMTQNHGLSELNTTKDEMNIILNAKYNDFKKCNVCNAIVRMESKKCNFCDSKLTDNKM